ncbi:LPXTG cell wall anchor domain-containing protein [Enteractinococcus coprophilus]|uniref:LPXTG cell wall anchor domain-containing protein n=1 Tax=Enteractinococcus coprophilus TaxID=1027633 RepID=UPI00115464A4|nr:PT domain-containing protein [Enteractinococcus coprophilus]
MTEPLDEDQWLTARAEAETPAPSAEPTDEPTTEPTVAPREEPSASPTEELTDVETDPMTEPTESPFEAVGMDDDTNADNLARTGAGVLWLIAAGVTAVILGAITMLLRRRSTSQS